MENKNVSLSDWLLKFVAGPLSWHGKQVRESSVKGDLGDVERTFWILSAQRFGVNSGWSGKKVDLKRQIQDAYLKCQYYLIITFIVCS